MPVTNYDEYYMREALALAKQGWGRTGINPLVGAVVVNRGRIVGRGFHRQIGEAHAETIALLEAGPRARGATLYVNLEPCCVCGRTPPCVDTISHSGIKDISVAMTDPNPLVNGRGIEALKTRRITVRIGLLADEAAAFNQAYRKYITQKIPYIIIKIAATRDGIITPQPGRGRYITGDPARRWAHCLRGRVDAVLVGIRTLLADDPLLTDRLVGRHDPARIVIDPHLKIPANAQFLNPGSRRIIITSRRSDPQKIKRLQEAGAEIVPFDGDYFPLKKVIRTLAEIGIGSLLIEGGAIVFAQAFSEDIYDELYLFESAVTYGTGLRLNDEIERIKTMPNREASTLGEDTAYHVYRNH